MKRILFAVFLGLLLTAGSAHADLVAHYTFSGNADDASGYGNHGTVIGATLTGDRFGNPDSAYLFDGVNDYIDILDSASLDLTDSFTISLWINQYSENSGGSRLVDKISAGFGDGYLLDTYPNRDIRLIVDGRSYSAYPDFALNEWHHLMATFDRGNYTIFLDGAVALSGTDPSWNPAVTNSLNLYLGRAHGDETIYFHGVMDDVMIYSSAVPEPTTILLLGAGLIGAAGVRRRLKP